MAKRRGNNEGNIRQRSDHSWEASVKIGNTRRYFYGHTKKEVKDKLANIQNDIYNGTVVDQNNITVAEWMRTWIESCTAKTKQSTKARYEQDIRNHIIPALGNIQIQELTDFTIQRFLNNCKNTNKLSEKSLKNIYLVLNKSLSKAQSKGLTKVNPCSEAEIPAYEDPKKKMRPLMDKEIPTFLHLISGQPFEELYYVALFTGMRESELIGLTWDCIDFDRGTVRIYRQLKAVRGESKTYTFTTLKNKQERSFAVPQSVIQSLKKVKVRQAEWKMRYGELYSNKGNLVFTNELGNHVATRTVYKRFKAIVAKMGLPQIRFHDLRHSYATLAIQNGVDYKTISHNLGHSTVAFTMDIYADVSMTMQKDSVQKMESFIASL